MQMNNIVMIVGYIILFGILIYFMTVRPQKKQQKELDEMHSKMKAGDSVLTTSGFYGVIIDIIEEPINDKDVKKTVIVEFGGNRNCRIPVQAEAISAVESSTPEKKADL